MTKIIKIEKTNANFFKKKLYEINMSPRRFSYKKKKKNEPTQDDFLNTPQIEVQVVLLSHANGKIVSILGY